MDRTVDSAKAIAGDAVTAMKEKTIALVDGMTSTVGTLIGGLTGLLVGLYAHRRAWDAATYQTVIRIEDAIKALQEIEAPLAALKKGALNDAERAELERLVGMIPKILKDL